MAGSLTLQSASPFSLKYLYGNIGGGSSIVTLTQAQLIAAFGAYRSPLKERLQGIVDDNTWTFALTTSFNDLFAYATEQGNLVATDTQIQFIPGPRRLQVKGIDGVDSFSIVELRLYHSLSK